MSDQDPNDAQESPEPQGDGASPPESHEAEEALSAAEDAMHRAAEASEADDRPAPTPEEEAMLAAFREAIDESDQAAASAGPGKTLGHGAVGISAATSASPFDLPMVQPGQASKVPEELKFLSDVNLNVRIELGRTRMYVEDVLRLGSGAVVELDKLAGDPVDVYVNNRHVARGEVLVLNDNFCVRINEILNVAESMTPGG